MGSLTLKCLETCRFSYFVTFVICAHDITLLLNPGDEPDAFTGCRWHRRTARVGSLRLTRRGIGGHSWGQWRGLRGKPRANTEDEFIVPKRNISRIAYKRKHIKLQVRYKAGDIELRSHYIHTYSPQVLKGNLCVPPTWRNKLIMESFIMYSLGSYYKKITSLLLFGSQTI